MDSALRQYARPKTTRVGGKRAGSRVLWLKLRVNTLYVVGTVTFCMVTADTLLFDLHCEAHVLSHVLHGRRVVSDDNR